MKATSAIRRWSKRVLYAVLTATVLLIIALLLVQTPPAKRVIANAVSRVASDATGLEIQLTGLHGWLPVTLRIEKLSAADAQGLFFEGDDLRVAWQPRALLGGAVHVSTLRAARIALARMPTLPPSDTPSSYAVPDWLHTPTWLTVDDFGVDRVELNAPLVDEPLQFVVNGSAKKTGTTQQWGANIRAQETGAATLTLDAAMNQRDNGLAITGAVHDDHFLPARLGVQGPVTLRLEGAGPAGAWQTNIEAATGDSVLADGRFTLGLGTPLALAGDLRLDAAHPLVPASVRGYAGNEATVHMKLALEESGLLNIESLAVEAPLAHAGGTGSVSLADLALDIEGTVQHGEPARLTPALADSGPLSLRATFEGTLEALEATLETRLDKVELAEANLTFDLTGPYRAQGSVHSAPPPGALPETLRALFEQSADATLDLAYDPAGVLTIDTFDATGAGASLSADGTVDFATQTAGLTLRATADDLAVYSGLADTPLEGDARINAQLEGTAAQASLELAAEASNLYAAGTHMAEAHLDLTATAGTWAGGSLGDVTFAGTGAFNGVAYADAPPGDWTLTLAGDTPDLDAITVAQLDVIGPGIRLESHGQGGVSTQAGDTALALAADNLRDTLAPFGFDATGSAHLDADVTFDAKAPRVTVQADGAGRDLAGLPYDLDAAIGDHFALRIEATADAKAAHIESFGFDGPHLQANAAGTYALGTGQTEVNAGLTVEDIAPFGAFAGMPLGGSVEAIVHATSPAGALTVGGQVMGNELRLDAVTLDHADLSFDIEEALDTPAGSTSLRITRGDKQLYAETRFTLEDELLRLVNTRLEAGENGVSGEAQVNMADMQGAGVLDAELTDLAYFGDLLGLELSGTASLAADFDTTAARPYVKASGDAAGIESPWARVGSATLEARIADPLTAPQGNLTLDVGELAAEGNRIATLTIEARGDRDHATADAAWEGNVLYDTALAGSLRLEAAPREQRITVAKLAGDLGEYAFALEKPSTFTVQGGGFQLEPLKLTLGDGHLNAQGRYTPEAVRLTARAEALPLAVAGLVGGPRLAGAVDATATLEGTPAAPTGGAEVTVTRFRMAAAPETAPELAVTVNTTYSSEQLDVVAHVDVPEAGQAEATAAVPVTFQLSPMTFDLAQDAPLTGGIDGAFALAPLAKAFAPPAHVAAGDLAIALRLDGTVATPEVYGKTTLADARYENAVTGTILEDIRAVIEAAGNRLHLAEFEARDAEDGAITGTGEVTLGGTFPFQLAMEMEQARLVHRDDVSGHLDGTIEAGGDLETVDVTGDLTVGPAVLRMPERMPPPTLPQADVTEVNDGGAALQEPQAASTSPAGPAVNLDVMCRLGKRVFIRAPVLESQWGGDLHITGTAARPRIEGVLRIGDGYIDFLGRRFDLDDSILSFDRGEDLMPYVNVTGRSETRQLTGIVRVSGKPENLRFALDSEPAYPEDEVLARLLFGSGMDELTPLQALQLARIATLLSGGAGADKLLSGQSLIPTGTTLDLRAGEQPGEATVGLGAYLTEDIYAEIETGAGVASNSTRMLIEFPKDFSIEVETGQQDHQGGGIFWKKDY